MTPEPEPEKIESIEDLRRILDEAGMPDVPVFELHDMISNPDQFEADIEKIREGITKRLEKDDTTNSTDSNNPRN